LTTCAAPLELEPPAGAVALAGEVAFVVVVVAEGLDVVVAVVLGLDELPQPPRPAVNTAAARSLNAVARPIANLLIANLQLS
jgi:hypothetical protein